MYFSFIRYHSWTRIASFWFNSIRIMLQYTKSRHSMNNNETKKDNDKRKLEKQTKEDIYYFRWRTWNDLDVNDGNNGGGNIIREISAQETGTQGFFRISGNILLLEWIDSMKKSLFILVPDDAHAPCSAGSSFGSNARRCKCACAEYNILDCCYKLRNKLRSAYIVRK